MLSLFLDGLVHGVWLLGALIPTLLVLGAVGYTIYRLWPEEPTLASFMEDFPPEIPTSEPEEEHRFIPSTIVRPPNIVAPGEDDDEDEEEGA